MTPSTRTTASLAIVTTVFALWLATLSPSLRPHAGATDVHVWGRRLDLAGMYAVIWATGLWVGGLAGVFVLRARRALSSRAVAAMGLGTVAFVAGIKLQYRLELFAPGEALAIPVDRIAEPGAHLPLGLLAGSVVAVGSAALLGSGWRQVGDAWAVAMSVMIPIGRVACLLAGCCYGVVCARWPSWLCLTYPRGSPAFSRQAAYGLVDPGSAASLPTHPLPIYFALASLATLAILLRLLRRERAPGTLLLAFAILRPAAKLGLEPLRADARPGPLMTAIPAVVLVGAIVVAIVILARRRRAR